MRELQHVAEMHPNDSYHLESPSRLRVRTSLREQDDCSPPRSLASWRVEASLDLASQDVRSSSPASFPVVLARLLDRCAKMNCGLWLAFQHRFSIDFKRIPLGNIVPTSYTNRWKIDHTCKIYVELIFNRFWITLHCYQIIKRNIKIIRHLLVLMFLHLHQSSNCDEELSP